MPIFMTPYFRAQPSVYLVSDAELKRYKVQQMRDELATLESMVQKHCEAISQLNQTISILKKDLPNTETSSPKCDS